MSEIERTEFIKGLELARRFFVELVEPLVGERLPELVYSAALLGAGSEVLGFDTEMSRDHHWGPRVMLFLTESDLSVHKEPLVEMLGRELPGEFKGYPTNFTEPSLEDGGTQLMEFCDGPVNHRVELNSIAGYLQIYLGIDIERELDAADWLTIPQQKLRSLKSGEIFKDGLSLASTLDRLAFYPHDIWLYLLASTWQRIEQDEHLMGRAGIVGDEIGSSIIAARLVRDIMQLCFLMEKTYAPYAKWYGTAFEQLACSDRLEPALASALRASEWRQRQEALAECYLAIIELHNELGITRYMPVEVKQFHDRPFKVASMGSFSADIAAAIEDPQVKALTDKRLIGSIDLLSDSTDLLEGIEFRQALRGLFL